MRDINYEKLTKRAIAIYTLERAALLQGNSEALGETALKKAELLSELDAIECRLKTQHGTSASVQCREQLASLHGIIERRTSENGQLARANNPTEKSMWPPA